MNEKKPSRSALQIERAVIAQCVDSLTDTLLTGITDADKEYVRKCRSMFEQYLEVIDDALRADDTQTKMF